MNPPSDPQPEVTALPMAMRLAAIFALAFVVVVLFGFIDRAGRVRLETATEKPPEVHAAEKPGK